MKLFRGVVVDNKDPNKGGRVKVHIFDIHGPLKEFSESKYSGYNSDSKIEETSNTPEGLPWAEIIQPISFIGFFNTSHFESNEKSKKSIDGSGSANDKSRTLKNSKGDRIGGFGTNIILEIGTWVFVVFEETDKNFQKPLILGCVSSDGEINENSSPTNKRVYKSTSGHYEEWNDTPGKECIIQKHRTGTEIEYAHDGNLEIQVTKDLKTYTMANVNTQTDGNIVASTKGNIVTSTKGNETNKVQGDVVNDIGGSEVRKIGSAQNIQAGGNIFVKGSKIFLNC